MLARCEPGACAPSSYPDVIRAAVAVERGGGLVFGLEYNDVTRAIGDLDGGRLRALAERWVEWFADEHGDDGRREAARIATALGLPSVWPVRALERDPEIDLLLAELVRRAASDEARRPPEPLPPQPEGMDRPDALAHSSVWQPAREKRTGVVVLNAPTMNHAGEIARFEASCRAPMPAGVRALYAATKSLGPLMLPLARVTMVAIATTLATVRFFTLAETSAAGTVVAWRPRKTGIYLVAAESRVRLLLLALDAPSYLRSLVGAPRERGWSSLRLLRGGRERAHRGRALRGSPRMAQGCPRRQRSARLRRRGRLRLYGFVSRALHSW